MTWETLGSAAWDSLEFEKKGSTAGFKPGTKAPPTPEEAAIAAAVAEEEAAAAAAAAVTAPWETPAWSAAPPPMSSFASFMGAIHGGGSTASPAQVYDATLQSLPPPMRANPLVQLFQTLAVARAHPLLLAKERMFAPGKLRGGVKLPVVPATAGAAAPSAAAASAEAAAVALDAAAAASSEASASAAASAASAAPGAAVPAVAGGKPDFDSPGVRGTWSGSAGENPFPLLIDAELLGSHAGRATLTAGLTRLLSILRGQSTAAVVALLQAAPATFLVLGKGEGSNTWRLCRLPRTHPRRRIAEYPPTTIDGSDHNAMGWPGSSGGGGAAGPGGISGLWGPSGHSAAAAAAAPAPSPEAPWDPEEDIEMTDVGGGAGGRARGGRGEKMDYSWQELADMTEAAAGEVIAALDRLPPLDAAALVADAEADAEAEEF